MEELLDLAVRHEMGHGLCGEVVEEKADRTATLLREGQRISCQGTLAALN